MQTISVVSRYREDSRTLTTGRRGGMGYVWGGGRDR